MRFFRRRISGDNLPSGVAFRKASMPPLYSIVRIAAAERRIRTGPSTSDNTEIVCRLGRKRRFVLTLEWLTLWPTWTPLPVMGHFRAMGTSLSDADHQTRRAACPIRNWATRRRFLGRPPPGARAPRAPPLPGPGGGGPWGQGPRAGEGVRRRKDPHPSAGCR